METTMWRQFRTYGLDYCDLPTMIKNFTTMLRWMAIDIDPRNKPVTILCYFVAITMGGGYVYVYDISMAWFIFWRCRETGDMLSAVRVFSLGATSNMSLMTYFGTLAQRKKLRNLTSAYLASNSQVKPNTRFAANIKKHLRTVKKRALIVWSVIIFNGILYILTPLCSPGRQLIDDFFVYFGFGDLDNMIVSPNFEIVVTLNVLAILFAIFPLANVIAYFIVTVGYVEAQILALSIELTNLWDDAKINCNTNIGFISHVTDATEDLSRASNVNGESGLKMDSHGSRHNSVSNIFVASTQATENNKDLNQTRQNFDQNNSSTSLNKFHYSGKLNSNNQNEILNRFIKKRLEDIIKSHTMNINLLQETEDAFNTIIAIKFIFVMMGFTAQLMGGLDNRYIALPYSLMPIIIDCVVGQHLKDACTIFERAVYDSKWENFDVKNQKMILVMLTNSQKDTMVSAGGIAPLSLQLLMSVFNKTYSAYTTLRSTVK